MSEKDYNFLSQGTKEGVKFINYFIGVVITKN